MIKNFRELRVWNNSVELAVAVNKATETFPKHEQYGLGSQMQRSSVSVPSNIAEGNGRHSTKENLHHLHFAYGSLSELETQIEIANRLNYISQKQKDDLDSACSLVGKELMNLIKALTRLIE